MTADTCPETTKLSVVDNCPERMDSADAVDTCPRLKSTERTNATNLEAAVFSPGFFSWFLTAVDNCPERMQAADAEAPRPPRIETAVEF